MNSVKNTHVQLLASIWPGHLFEESVLVLGERGLDRLAATRTLNALTWKELQPVVEAWEDAFVTLRHCMARTHSLRHCVVRTEGPHTPSKLLPKTALRLIDEYGNFTADLAVKHFELAAERCRIEQSLSVSLRDVSQFTSAGLAVI